jgi:hypothetical protein
MAGMPYIGLGDLTRPLTRSRVFAAIGLNGLLNEAAAANKKLTSK